MEVMENPILVFGPLMCMIGDDLINLAADFFLH